MPMMVAPDGIETMDVPDSLVEHYKSTGAMVVEAPKPPAPGLGQRIGEMPLLPMMGAQSPRLRDAAWTLPIAGGAIPGPIGMAGAGAGELARQSLTGEDMNPMKAGEAAALAGLFGLLGKVPGLIRGASGSAKGKGAMAAAGELAKGIPVLGRAGKARDAYRAATSAKAEAPGALDEVRRQLLNKPAKSAYSRLEGVLDDFKPKAEPTPAVTTGGATQTIAVGNAPAKVIPIKSVPRGTSPRAKPMPKVPAKEATKGVDTVPIKVQGKPKAVRGVKQRGVSKREIASRQRGMAEASGTPDISGLSPYAEALEGAAKSGDPVARLTAELAFDKELVRRGFPPEVRKALRRGAQSFLHGGGAAQ